MAKKIKPVNTEYNSVKSDDVDIGCNNVNSTFEQTPDIVVSDKIREKLESLERIEKENIRLTKENSVL